MSSNEFYKIGKLSVLRSMSKEEIAHATKDVIAKLKPFFVEDCIIPISTSIGNDVTIAVKVEKENVKFEFKEEYQGHELPEFYSYEQWKLSIYNLVYQLVSDNGRKQPLVETKQVLSYIKNMKDQPESKSVEQTSKSATAVDNKTKSAKSKTKSKMIIDKIRKEYGRKV